MIHKVLKKQTSSDDCFICGIHNPFGLKVNFYEVEGDEVVALVNLSNEYQSYPGRCHGGVIAALLDETIGRALNITEPYDLGVTIDLKITYRKPVPLNEDIKVIGRITKKTRRSFEGTGEIIDKDGNVLASGIGTYMNANVNKICEGISEDEAKKFMYVVPLKSDPTEIDY